MNCDLNLYSLPTISFVGGETQDLKFYIYDYREKDPVDLSGSTSEFTIVYAHNKTGAPVVNKTMDIEYNDDVEISHILSVVLDPSDTLDLNGKYIYQISIQQKDGSIEIPHQGLMYIINNIDRPYYVNGSAGENSTTLTWQ